MKKGKPEPKFDFYQILYRRRWSVSRWAENEGIKTQEQALSWVSANEEQYIISEQFLQELFDYVSSVEVKEEKQEPITIVQNKEDDTVVTEQDTTQEMTEQEPLENLQNDSVTVSAKPKNKKKVQTEEETE